MAAVNSGNLAKNEYYFAGWNTRPDGLGNDYKPGKVFNIQADVELYAKWLPGTPDTTFYAVTTDNIWYRVEARKLAENEKCIVYGDIKENISAIDAEHIAEEYKNAISPKITSSFGDITYMPNNGDKLFLLLMDIIDGFTGGGYVAGYFDATHMYETKHSNRAAMLFMDVSPGNPSNIKEFCTVIAHEMQHLINFSIGKGNSKNIWINEGLSLAAEYIYGGEQNARINYFNGHYGNTTIPYGNNFFVWDGYWEQQYGDVLADYATAYLFFRWLGIQAGNTTIYKQIVDSPHTDYRAVTGPATQIDAAFFDWETLLGAWMLANYYQQTDGFYGYKAKIPPLNISDLRVVGSQYSLSPGEGVFSSNPSGSELPYTWEGNIYYIGLPKGNFSTSPGSLLGSGPYTGEKLLTFNGNTNEKGNNEYGYVVASRLPGSGGTGRNTATRNVPGPIAFPPGDYPISFGDMAEQNRHDRQHTER